MRGLEGEGSGLGWGLKWRKQKRRPSLVAWGNAGLGPCLGRGVKAKEAGGTRAPSGREAARGLGGSALRLGSTSRK